MNENVDSERTRNPTKQSRKRSLLVSVTTQSYLTMRIPKLTLSELILIWIGPRKKGNKLVFEYEIKPYTFPTGGGRHCRGWFVLQDGVPRDFFQDEEAANNCYEQLLKDQEEQG
mgnify:CR=1 FL=1